MAVLELTTLFQRLREGDRDAFTSIYQELKQPVYTICWRIVQRKEIAEDLTQDVFIKLYTAPPPSSVKNERAWVFQVARNASIDALRKHREQQLEDREYSAGQPELDRLDQRMDVERAMAQLCAEDRELLTLHLNAELTFQQIGQITGRSLPSVYRAYQKAIKTLRELLEGGCP